MAQALARLDVATAAARLRAGGVVAFPTETVYGLGACADEPAAVARVFAAKGRPAFNPLIAHVTDLEAACALVDLPPAALRLAEAFWPGPLTLVGARRPGGVCDLAAAGLASAAVRAPAHPDALALLRAVGRPVAAPSANLSGAVSPTTAAHVEAGLAGRIDGVLDGGPCAVGVESTIVAVERAGAARLLRPGGIARAALEAALGAPLTTHSPAGAPTAPGQLASHYAPAARLRLNAAAPRPGEAWLGFGPAPAAVTAAEDPSEMLSRKGDVVEAAAALYAALRRLDAAVGPGGAIAVAPIPDDGLGEAINDRLRRAAAPRA